MTFLSEYFTTGESKFKPYSTPPIATSTSDTFFKKSCFTHAKYLRVLKRG